MPKKADIPSKWNWRNTVFLILAVLSLLWGFDLPPFRFQIPISVKSQGTLTDVNGVPIETVDVQLSGETTYHLLTGTEFYGDMQLNGDSVSGGHTVLLHGSYDGFFRFCSYGVVYGAGIHFRQPWGEYDISQIRYDLTMRRVEFTFYLLHSGAPAYLRIG